MASRFDELQVTDGDLVAAKDMPRALTEAVLDFGDGATQSFAVDGTTTYTERGRPTRGEWSVVGDGEFSSFWPPAFRAAYTLRWIVEDDAVTGLSFTQNGSGDRFAGRYR